MLHVGLLNGVSRLQVGRALGINHGASGVARRLVHGSLVDESLGVCGGGVLSSDLHAIVLPHADARGRRARVDADSHAEDFVHQLLRRLETPRPCATWPGGSLTTCPGRSPGPSSGMAGPLFSPSLPQEVPEEGVEEVKQRHGRCFPATRRRLLSLGLGSVPPSSSSC